MLTVKELAMLNLQRMSLFIAVVDSGSFTA
ncbi:hypothetical protein WJD28_19355, partial [Salmonella enterica subsp. enterica serovar Corvallis]